MFILHMPIHLMNDNGLLREFIPKRASLKELNQNLLENYTKAINERPRRIHGYQSAKKLFELIQTARKILT